MNFLLFTFSAIKSECMSTEQKISIDIRLPVTAEAFADAAKSSPVDAAKSLDAELDAFDAVLVSKGAAQLARFERQIVREYLAHKVLKNF